jgi:hypothetical protein
VWINLTGEEALFRQVRDRAYAFCLRDGAIDRHCAREQDHAVHSSVLAWLLVGEQRRMPDKSQLGTKERWVAEHPEIATGARAYCWALYNAHGRMDARLLSVCLGNLTDFTPLVDLPVVD